MIKFDQSCQWYDMGIQSLSDIFGELTLQFNLQHSTFYFYLQLRAAMKTYSVQYLGKAHWRNTQAFHSGQ